MCRTGTRVVQGGLGGLYSYLQHQSKVRRLWHCLLYTPGWDSEKCKIHAAPTLFGKSIPHYDPHIESFSWKAHRAFFFFKQRERKINTCLCFCCLIELHSSIFCPFNGSNPLWKRKGNVPLFICTAHTIIYLWKKKMINLKDNSSDSDVVSQKWEGLFSPK